MTENILALVNPKLALEWHPTLNGVLTPLAITVSSSKKVWWQCSEHKEHCWESTVSNRNRGNGCPYCCNKTSLLGFNDLTTTNPKLANEWHTTLNGDNRPSDFTCGSSKNVWWQCSKHFEHQWQAGISVRNRGNGCPYCSNKKVMSGYNDLESLNPTLAGEWHSTLNGSDKPSDFTCGSSRNVWWQCSEYKEHYWEERIYERNAGRRCPYCSNKKVLVGYNDLATTNPELAGEWHPILNGDLTPKDIVSGSHKNVWWQCSKYNEHCWEAGVRERTRGNGCPYCSGHKVFSGHSDLASINPTLAAEWHPTKNGDLIPGEVMPASNKKAWWRCSKHEDHEWSATIDSRNSGAGCPYCSNKKVLPGYNDLASVNPELAKEWHTKLNGDRNPSNIVYGSNKKVWWQCSKYEEHYWETTVSERRSGKCCPYCSNRKTLSGYNDLATTNPSLAKEWHSTKNGDLTPFDITGGSNRKVWWQCRKGHEWRTAVAGRSAGRGCKQCNSETQTSFPEQAVYYYLNRALPVPVENRVSVFGVEVDVYIPSWDIGIEYDGMYFHNSEKSEALENKKNKILSTNGIQLIRIKEGREVSESDDNHRIISCMPDSRYNYLKPTLNALAEMLSQMRNIPILLDVDIDRDNIGIAEQYIESEKRNSMVVRNPTVAAEWHPIKNGRLNPEQISFGSQQKVWWQCSKHKEHQWKASPLARNNGGTGCPYCSSNKVLAGYSDLATTNPELAKEWHPTSNGDLTPKDVRCGSNKKVWWQCEKKHEWQALVNNRSRGTGCPYCTGRYIIEGETDLATTHPELTLEWHPILNGDITPNSVTHASNKKIWWQCNKHEEHHWKASPLTRTFGSGCPYCCNKTVLKGYNDLATIYPELAEEWHPTLNGEVTPFNISGGSKKKVWWQCGKKHEWQAYISSRKIGYSSCPECKKTEITEDPCFLIETDSKRNKQF